MWTYSNGDKYSTKILLEKKVNGSMTKEKEFTYFIKVLK